MRREGAEEKVEGVAEEKVSGERGGRRECKSPVESFIKVDLLGHEPSSKAVIALTLRLTRALRRHIAPKVRCLYQVKRVKRGDLPSVLF